MSFKEAYQDFIQEHCEHRSGERLRRLQQGHGHGEKRFLRDVWWPSFRQFSYLHPEYEVHDYKDGYRYLDFAYIQPNFRVAIEIDGFGSHWRNISNWQFDDHCQRQNDLIIDGWYVVRVTYNQIKEKPRLCQQTIQQLLGRWLPSSAAVGELTIMEREVIRFAARATYPITPKDIALQMGVGPDYAQRLLRSLVDKQWLQPASGNIRIRSYKLHPARGDIRL